MLNYPEIANMKTEEISKIEFFSLTNENLKKNIISLMLDRNDNKNIKSRINSEFISTVEEISENSSIQIITKAKDDNAISELLNELLVELKEIGNLKKIESLEKELINNLDEGSYSELLKLKSQLNRE